MLNDDPGLYMRWKDTRAAAAGPSLYQAVHKITHERARAAKADDETLADAVNRVLDADPALRDLYALCASPVSKLATGTAVEEILKQCTPAEATTVRSAVRKVLKVIR